MGKSQPQCAPRCRRNRVGDKPGSFPLVVHHEDIGRPEPTVYAKAYGRSGITNGRVAGAHFDNLQLGAVTASRYGGPLNLVDRASYCGDDLNRIAATQTIPKPRPKTYGRWSNL